MRAVVLREGRLTVREIAVPSRRKASRSTLRFMSPPAQARPSFALSHERIRSSASIRKITRGLAS
jgi:hypothetical protein